MNYDHFMALAIDIGKRNPKAPFGSVLVDSESHDIAATGLNQSASNPTLHGEMVAINNYAELGINQWNRLTLFTTAEPCCMCQAAIIWAGIPTVVFGTSIRTLKHLGLRQFDLTANQVIAAARFADCKLIGGVAEKQCDQLFERKSNR